MVFCFKLLHFGVIQHIAIDNTPGNEVNVLLTLKAKGDLRFITLCFSRRHTWSSLQHCERSRESVISESWSPDGLAQSTSVSQGQNQEKSSLGPFHRAFPVSLFRSWLSQKDPKNQYKRKSPQRVPNFKILPKRQLALRNTPLLPASLPLRFSKHGRVYGLGSCPKL